MSDIIRTVNDLILDARIDEATDLLNRALASEPTNLALHQLEVRLLLVRNKPEDARTYLEALDTGADPAVTAARADLLVTLGDAGEALQLLVARFDRPGASLPPSILKAWADAADAAGQAPLALECGRLAESASPGCIPIHFLQRLQQQAVRKGTIRRSLDAMLTEYALAEGVRPTPELAAHLLRLFRGRADAHARQTRFRQGNWGYVPVQEPLSIEHLVWHIGGRETLGVYLLDEESNTNLLCLDLDVAKSVLPAYEDGTRAGEFDASLKKLARDLIVRADGFGIALYPESSGRKGIHLWGFFDQPVPARHVRLLAGAILEGVRLPDGLQIDLFPAQDRLSGKGFGNLVKIPLGIHQATGRRSMFLHPETCEPCPDAAAYLDCIRPMPPERLKEVASRLVDDRPAPGASGASVIAVQVHRETSEDAGGIRPAVVRPIDQVPEAVEHLLRGCAFAFHLVAKARQGVALEESEAHVLAYMLKPLGQEGEIFFHQAMGLTGSYDPEWGLAKLHAVGPAIISCEKVRKRLAHLAGTLPCVCPFDLPAKSYPSPLVHAGLIPVCMGMVPYGKSPAPESEPPACPRKVGMPDVVTAQRARVVREQGRLEALLAEAEKREQLRAAG